MSTLGLKVELDTDNMAVVVNVVDRDDKNRLVEARSFLASDIHDSLRGSVALYGLSKLIQDRTSDCSVKENSVAKLDAMEGVLARLNAGEWSAERKVGAPTVSIEVEALAAFKGEPISAIQKALRNYSKEQKAQIFANPAIKAKVEEIKASRETQEEVELDNLL